MYIGDHWGGIATAVYSTQFHDLRSGRQFVAGAVFWREREGEESYFARLSDVHNPGSCCFATKGTCAGYGVHPMIADDMDIGDRRSGITITSSAGYRSGSQDHGSSWCYTLADREGFRGWHTYWFDVHSAGRCCRATTGRCAGYGVHPVIAFDMDTGYDGRCVASTTGDYSVCQDLLSGWCYTLADREGFRGWHTCWSDVHNAGCSCYATNGTCACYGIHPMIADDMDIGNRRCGIANTTTGNFSVRQDLIRSWCYPIAYRERLRGRLTDATCTVRIVELANC